ncbi:TPA: hypothetical protein QDZ12_004204 [Pseudomonas putida]|uniref:hypothetical protein n=1 Tax=Pseudomonas sp. HD6515 TaxID=2856556 RepID=UPI00217F2134|nr:hypothetical protein [Pseudomonas sp. HD6515]ELS0926018.1 hypothetical protein [Pseudomonas putida]UWH23467.1 hypothetical protein KW568_03345 [Pseudomonas sp. HD6515]HDS0940906.1 hypothetical protein [Pseudomonas putida]
MNKPTPTIDLTNACTMAIAAGTASDYACRAQSAGYNPDVARALEKVSLRFAELALEALGGEAGKGAGDEAASA